MRVGEEKGGALAREDVDGVAHTVIVNQQVLRHIYGRRRANAARGPDDGSALRGARGDLDGAGECVAAHAGRLAGLPENSWHPLRHTFATHAAVCGVNPSALNSGMGRWWLLRESNPEPYAYEASALTS